MSNSNWKPIAAFAAVYFFWGTTYLGIRYAIETLPPFLMGFIRFSLASVGYLLILGATGRWRTPTPSQVLHASIAGVLMLAGGNGAVTWAEQKVPSGVTSLLIGTTPFWLVLFDWKWRRTRPPMRSHWVGIGVGFAGMAVLVAPESLAGAGRADLTGAAALFAASILWSAGSAWAKKHPGPESPLMAALLQMAAGSVALLLLSLIRGETAGFSFAQVSDRSWWAVGYLLVGGSLIGYTAWVYLLKNTSAARASTTTYVNPMVAVLLGWLVGREPFSPRLFVALPVILLSVFLMARSAGRKGAVVNP